MIPDQNAIDVGAEILTNRSPAPNSGRVRSDTVNMNTSGKENLNVGINNGTISTRTIVPQPRKASLFQLPATNPNFTGRSIEIDKIEAILTSENPMALISAVSGMGGVGKSTLAKAIGNRLKGQYPDGQLYVDLRGQSESPREPIAVLSEFLVDGFGDEPQNLPIELDRLQRLFNDRLTNLLIITNLNRVALSCTVEVWGLSTLVFGLNIVPCNKYAKVIPHRSTEVLF